MTIPARFGCYQARAEVGICSPGSRYLPNYWFSKFPSKTSSTWNLLKLFDPLTWMLVFASIVSVAVVLYISARIGTSYFGLQAVSQEIVLSPFRIPILANQQSTFGFSSAMIFLVWCVCGGLLLHCFECNFLATLIKTNYEMPIDTAEDILGRGFSILTVIRREGIVEAMKSSHSKITRDLAEATIIPKVLINISIFQSLINYHFLIKYWDDWIREAKTLIFGSPSTAVAVQSYLLDFQLAQGHWYRSRGIQSGDFLFGLNMLNKKWTLEEEYNRHLYQFQQVNIISIKLKIDILS